MPNPHAQPLQARLARKAQGKPRNLQAVAEKLWRALETAEALLEESQPELRLKAVHAVTQAAAAYARVYETGELEARLEALEALRGST